MDEKEFKFRAESEQMESVVAVVADIVSAYYMALRMNKVSEELSQKLVIDYAHIMWVNAMGTPKTYDDKEKE